MNLPVEKERQALDRQRGDKRMSEYVIETRQVTKHYGRLQALSQVDINGKKGSIYGLIGDNGAGKSTLLKLLAGHCFATSGEILLFGQSGEKERERRRRQTGIMIEQAGFVPGMTVKQMLEYCRLQRGIAGKKKTEEILQLTGIWEKRKSKCKNLSLGQKQRLGLAIALIGEPQLLILDEPINGLDPSGIVEMRNLFRRLNEEKNITILLSSHILSELQQVASDFGFLYQGRMLEEISAKKILEKCSDSLNIEISDPERYAALLSSCFPGEIFRVMPEQAIQISNPQREAQDYSRLAAEHGFLIKRLERQHGSLEDYYMNLKNGGTKAC